MEQSIEKIKKEGKIYFWRYTENTRNYPGWNISFDDDGFTFLNRLLNLMQKSQWPSKKSISTDPPTEKVLLGVNNSGGRASWKTVKTLSIQYKKKSPYPNLWRLNEEEQALTISMGSNKLNEFITAIIDTKKDHGDFAISDSIEENILYFWRF